MKLFAGEERKEVKDILDEITSVSQKYLTGRILSMISIFILYVIALSIIGIKNAVLLSVIASILTIVPYIGPLVGGLFPVLTALITYDTIQPAIWVFIAFLLIQVIDDYLVEPNVLGGEVNLTALSTIIAIILGGMLWGIAGMILFIPMLSIAKIIFDKVDHLHPYGFLIGDESSRPSERIFSFFKRVFKRHS